MRQVAHVPFRFFQFSGIEHHQLINELVIYFERSLEKGKINITNTGNVKRSSRYRIVKIVSESAMTYNVAGFRKTNDQVFFFIPFFMHLHNSTIKKIDPGYRIPFLK